MIVTITGASGSGKDSVFKLLKKDNPSLKFVPSTTTRKPRPAGHPRPDPPWAYQYVNAEEFELLKKGGKFEWCIGIHDNAYGTLKKSLQEALESQEIFFLILVPDKARLLFEISGGKTIPFYILSPGETELRKRLKISGESDDSIEKRIFDCRLWDMEARRAARHENIPYYFISNPEIELKEKIGLEAARQIREILKQHNISI